MTVLRGKGFGIEIAFAGRYFDDVLAELQTKLDEQPLFYSGTAATAALGVANLSGEQLARLLELLREHGIALEALSGDRQLEPLADSFGLRFVVDASAGEQEFARRRAAAAGAPALSESARSLAADFAGARAEIAARRARGQASVRRVAFASAAQVPAAAEVPAPPSTLYHNGTVRGGQSLQHVGNIVIAGDVNPGAELVATGDILVFGSLRGVAHAGAQGDRSARVYALRLEPTQLRIATCIAAEAGAKGTAATEPQAALLQDDRIVVVPHDRVEPLREGEAR